MEPAPEGGAERGQAKSASHGELCQSSRAAEQAVPTVRDGERRESSVRVGSQGAAWLGGRASVGPVATARRRPRLGDEFPPQLLPTV